MSSNTYTLKIDIDDSKIRELERRLMAAMNGGVGTSGMGGLGAKMKGAASGGGAGKAGGIAGNIAKLGVIAIGVGSLVMLFQKLMGMIVDSSPMLKQMLKLLNFSVMLILRPIGDFIGFFLKPVIIYFLRSVVIPWYKEMRKPMMQAGAKAGQQFLDDPLKSMGSAGIFGIGGFVATHLDEIQNAMQSIPESINIYVGKLLALVPTPDFTALKTWLDGLTFPTVDWSFVTTFLDKFSLDNLPTVDWSFIKTFLDKFSLDNLPKFNWTWLKEFLKKFGILQVPTFSWTGLEEGIKTLKLKLQEALDSILGFFQWIVDLITGNSGGGDGVGGGTTNNFMIDINGNGIDDATDVGNALSNFADWVTGKG
tara:strand:- start:1262 stop:2359 length:1098 start_codon:yes stop_codon:yes gene_type:complete